MKPAVIEYALVMFAVGKRDFGCTRAAAGRTHARTHAHTLAQVLAQASGPTFSERRVQGGWNSPSATKLRIKRAQVMLAALLVPGGSENQRPLPPKSEPNHTAASLTHYSLRYF